MLGDLYEQALTGKRCWLRHDDGRVHPLPVRSWLGGRGADDVFDRAVVGMCDGPTIDLACGPGRLVAHLIRRGIPALGVDQSATAVQLARRSGAPALHRDVFDPLPGTGRWHTVLLADGNVGLGGDPRRILVRASELLRR
ncbi:MAG TPA: class I SAM-dependent methyltransferase, partial [Mycobacterium sp.]